MNSQFSELEAKLLEFYALPEEGRLREKTLSLACELTGQPASSAALLYLYDPAKECFHLDHHHPDAPHRLAGVSILFPKAQLEDIPLVHRTLRQHSVIEDYREQQTPGGVSQFFQVRPTENSQRGVLEIRSTIQLSDTSQRLLQNLADAISSRIARHRYLRELGVFKQLIRTFPTNLQRNTREFDWQLHQAAKTAKEATDAKLALIFKDSPDALRLATSYPVVPPARTPIAGDASLIRKLFSKNATARVMDHRNLVERRALFNTNGHDAKLVEQIEALLGEPLRTWIASTVTIPASDGQPDEPYALLLVANKNPKYLPNCFSATDELLMTRICDVLSGTLPKVQVDDAIRMIPDVISELTIDQLSDREKIYKLITKLLPETTSAAITIRISKDSPPDDLFGLGPANRFTDLQSCLGEAQYKEHDSQNMLRPTASGSLPHDYYISDPLPIPNSGRIASLHLTFRKRQPRLRQHEKEILRFLCDCLAQPVRTLLLVRREVDTLLQVRHAIRSSLMGLTGHVQSAASGLELMSTKFQIDAPNHRWCNDFNRLKRSINHARMFGTRSTVLIEESRILLDNISKDNLNLGEHSLVDLISECNRAVGAEAERKKIDLHLVNQIPMSQTRVTIDETLILIALFNIIENAVKYSDDNKLVKITSYNEKGFWCVQVDNDGVWIPPDKLKLIFETFIRAPSESSLRVRPGTGIGLSVTQKIAKAHGGDVTVSSIARDARRPALGANTQFHLQIPRKNS